MLSFQKHRCDVDETLSCIRDDCSPQDHPSGGKRSRTSGIRTGVSVHGLTGLRQLGISPYSESPRARVMPVAGDSFSRCCSRWRLHEQRICRAVSEKLRRLRQLVLDPTALGKSLYSTARYRPRDAGDERVTSDLRDGCCIDRHMSRQGSFGRSAVAVGPIVNHEPAIKHRTAPCALRRRSVLQGV
jgi:hypothetical protein